MSVHESPTHLRTPAASASASADGGAGPTASSVAGLLAAAERLTAELAATQVAVQELTAHIARAGLSDAAPRPVAPGPAASPEASALPPRRGDHAVVAAPEAAVLAAGLTDGGPAPYEAPAPAAAPAFREPDGAFAGHAAEPAPARPVSVPAAAAPAPTPTDVGPGVLGTPAAPTFTDPAVRVLDPVGPIVARPQTVPAPSAPAPHVAQVPVQHQEAAPSFPREPATPSFPREPASSATAPTGPLGDPAFPSASAGAAARSPFDSHGSSLADVPLLSAGSVDVLVGPVSSLPELDALQGRVLDLPGVEAVTVTAFEGHDVLMSVDLDRPLPLASMLRTELGRDVASCRLVEGRIVVTFTHRGALA